jgi:hypothetical protein
MSVTSPYLGYRWTPRPDVRAPPLRPNSRQAAFHPSRSVADPASCWAGANGGLAFFAYCANYLVDLKHALIMDVEATTAVRQAEVTAQRVMLDRTRDRFETPKGSRNKYDYDDGCAAFRSRRKVKRKVWRNGR